MVHAVDGTCVMLRHRLGQFCRADHAVINVHGVISDQKLMTYTHVMLLGDDQLLSLIGLQQNDGQH